MSFIEGTGFLHLGPDRVRVKQTQLLSPSFNSLNLQQVRLKINENELMIVNLQSQIQPLPAVIKSEVEIGGRFVSITNKRGGRGRVFKKIFGLRETTQSRGNREKVRRENNKVKSQITKLKSELTQLTNQEKIMIQLQGQITNNQNEVIRLEKETAAREKSFFDQLGVAIAGAIPQQQLPMEEIQKKKPSNIPLIAGLGLIGVALLG